MTVNRDFCDVIIIGAGATGLSTYYHLSQLGYNIKLVASSTTPAVSDLSAEWGICGQSDMITRLAHAYSESIAQDVWSYGDRSLDYLTKLLLDFGLPFQGSDRLVLSTSKMESQELLKAKAILESGTKGIVWNTSYLGNKSFDCLKFKSGAISFSWKNLATKLLAQGEIVHDHISSMGETSAGMELRGKDSVYNSEIVIVAAHLATMELGSLPAESLISYADQWCEVDLSEDGSLGEIPNGSYISWNYGYFWLLKISSKRIRMGGGRFLRPMAGIDASGAEVVDKITKFLVKQLELVFGAKVETVLREKASLGCRPCDELPVVGPSFSTNRVLLATGFMGQGLAQGVYSGYCLSQLVKNGTTSLLPRIIWPERLRSF